MSEIIHSDNIRKAFIKADGNLKIEIAVPTDETGRIINDKRSIDRKVMPHSTLKRAFKNLLPHALNLLRLTPKGSVFDEKYIKSRKVVNDTDLRDYTVVGFERSGKDDEPELVIILRKSVFGEKTIDIKTKPTKTHGKTEYPFASLLVGDLDDCIEEVFEYINGKYYDSDQLTMNDSSEEEEEDIFGGE